MTITHTNRMFRLCLMLAALSRVAPAGSKAIFETPDEAATALVATLASGDYVQFLTVAGSRMAEFWSSGDPEKDAWEKNAFLEAARKSGIQADWVSPHRKMLYAGTAGKPFPAPLVKTESGWRFDDDAGWRELARRRIHRNETAVVELCLRFREAEYEYRATVTAGGPSFAARIRSTPGQHNGLFWTGGDEDDESPLGPPFAAAAFAERKSDGDARPLFGYYFKVLWAQGQDAAGGALDYHTHGQLRKGFALVAWPADYGVAGNETFLINHFGDIYRKNLGPDTSRIAESMMVFNPDRSWSKLSALD